jgi:hypothetical protein
VVGVVVVIDVSDLNMRFEDGGFDRHAKL